MPKKADTHIQNSAPGPPTLMAPVTPRMLPGPTRMAVDSRKDAQGEMPVLAFCSLRTRMPCRNLRTWMNRSWQVKKMPEPMSRMMARLKLPRMGMFAYQSKLVGKLQNRSETTWIFWHTALTASNSACIGCLSFFFYHGISMVNIIAKPVEDAREIGCFHKAVRRTGLS